MEPASTGECIRVGCCNHRRLTEPYCSRYCRECHVWNVLQAFTPRGYADQDFLVDPDEWPNVAMPVPEPLVLIPTPRVTHQVYVVIA